MGFPSARIWSLWVYVSSQALCTAVAGPSLLKTILQFFSAAEAGLAADPTAPDITPVAEPWWDLESKRNHAGNSIPFSCDRAVSFLPLPQCPRAQDSQGTKCQTHCTPLLEWGRAVSTSGSPFFGIPSCLEHSFAYTYTSKGLTAP